MSGPGFENDHLFTPSLIYDLGQFFSFFLHQKSIKLHVNIHVHVCMCNYQIIFQFVL